jgi:enoyl-CoA hydratase/carnithine racemase
MREFAEGTEASGRALITSLAALCAIARKLPKPVACAIQGHCLGGALEFAACCDFRICTADAQLGMPEVFLGIPSVIDAAMLERHVGAGRAHELLLTGDAISGDVAHQWGLVNRLAPTDALMDVAAVMLRSATRHDPDVVASQKALHEHWLSASYNDAVDHSIESLVAAFSSGRPRELGAARLQTGGKK